MRRIPKAGEEGLLHLHLFSVLIMSTEKFNKWLIRMKISESVKLTPFSMHGTWGFGTLFKPLLCSSYHKLIANISVNVTRTIKAFF